MKTRSLIAIACLALAALGTGYALWWKRVTSTCPALERLREANAADDARRALARGDRRLLMIGGYVGEIPHLPSDFDRSNFDAAIILMDGTGDTVPEPCYRLRFVAEAYAEKYNAVVVEAAR